MLRATNIPTDVIEKAMSNALSSELNIRDMNLYKAHLAIYNEKRKNKKLSPDEELFINVFIEAMKNGYQDAKQYLDDHKYSYYWSYVQSIFVTGAVGAAVYTVSEGAGQRAQLCLTGCISTVTMLLSLWKGSSDRKKYNDAWMFYHNLCSLGSDTLAEDSIIDCATELCFRFQEAIRYKLSNANNGGIRVLARFFAMAISLKLTQRKNTDKLSDYMLEAATPDMDSNLYRQGLSLRNTRLRVRDGVADGEDWTIKGLIHRSPALDAHGRFYVPENFNKVSGGRYNGLPKYPKQIQAKEKVEAEKRSHANINCPKTTNQFNLFPPADVRERREMVNKKIREFSTKLNSSRKAAKNILTIPGVPADYQIPVYNTRDDESNAARSAIQYLRA